MVSIAIVVLDDKICREDILVHAYRLARVLAYQKISFAVHPS
jgi:hypothetical protein